MTPIVEAELFRRKKTLALTRWLLGKHLVRRFADGRVDARMIVETEAYNGESDLACHARAGRTGRTDVLYGPGGVWYVYLCYGIHEMLNLVVGPSDWPAAILIRGVEGAIGPGRVTKTLGINRELNRAPAAETSGLWIEDRGVRIPPALIVRTPRIGVEYAGPVWSAKPWRFTFNPRALPPSRAARILPAATRDPDRNGAPAHAEPAAPTSRDLSVQTGARTVRRTRLRDD
jgi:DNA-3-methyladenine glycosylase